MAEIEGIVAVSRVHPESVDSDEKREPVMPSTQQGLTGLRQRWRARRAKLPWHEIEAEAARQGCSPADIFFDRAGLGDPIEAGPATAPPEHETAREGIPWRGLDPLPASRTG